MKPEPNSATHSAQSCVQRLRKYSKQHWEPELGEALSLGNELCASLGPCSLSTVSNSLGKEQGEHLSDTVRVHTTEPNSAGKSKLFALH
jgi:hypothetical protein